MYYIIGDDNFMTKKPITDKWIDFFISVIKWAVAIIVMTNFAAVCFIGYMINFISEKATMEEFFYCIGERLEETYGRIYS